MEHLVSILLSSLEKVGLPIIEGRIGTQGYLPIDYVIIFNWGFRIGIYRLRSIYVFVIRAIAEIGVVLEEVEYV